MEIMIKLPQIVIWPARPNLKLFGPIKTELWAKKVIKISVMMAVTIYIYRDFLNFEQLLIACLQSRPWNGQKPEVWKAFKNSTSEI